MSLYLRARLLAATGLRLLADAADPTVGRIHTPAERADRRRHLSVVPAGYAQGRADLALTRGGCPLPPTPGAAPCGDTGCTFAHGAHWPPGMPHRAHPHPSTRTLT